MDINDEEVSQISLRITVALGNYDLVEGDEVQTILSPSHKAQMAQDKKDIADRFEELRSSLDDNTAWRLASTEFTHHIIRNTVLKDIMKHETAQSILSKESNTRIR